MKLCLATIGFILLCSCCQTTEKQDADTQQIKLGDAAIIAGAPSASSTEPPSSSAQDPDPSSSAFGFNFKKPGPEWHQITFDSIASFENLNEDQIHLTADQANSLSEAMSAIVPILKKPKPKYLSEWKVDKNRNMAECDLAWESRIAKIIIRFFPKINLVLMGIAVSDTLKGVQKAGFLTRDIVRSAEIHRATPEERKQLKKKKKNRPNPPISESLPKLC